MLIPAADNRQHFSRRERTRYMNSWQSHQGLESPPGRAEARAAGRSNMYVGAILVCEATSAPVKIRNLAAHGALIQGVRLPEAGLAARLVRGSISAEAHVVWRTGNKCGLHFPEPTDVAVWLASRGSPQQQRVDSVVRLVRSGKNSAVAAAYETGPETADLGQATGASHKQSLRQISLLLESLSDDFAEDASMLQAYGDKLQVLDLAVRKLNSLVDQDSSDATPVTRQRPPQSDTPESRSYWSFDRGAT